MTRFTITICVCLVSVAGIAAAQDRPAPLEAPAARAGSSASILPPLTPSSQPASPGEYLMTREARAHEQYLLQSQAQAESVHQAAVARAQQRARRLESQRWFGISNARPTCSADPFNGDYSPGWVSNYLFYPYRWVGSGEPWGVVQGE